MGVAKFLVAADVVADGQNVVGVFATIGGWAFSLAAAIASGTLSKEPFRGCDVHRAGGGDNVTRLAPPLGGLAGHIMALGKRR
jgi:hypothetical protein